MNGWVTVVKSPLAFLQIQPELGLWNAIEFAHMPLGLVPKVLNPIDVIMLMSEALGMIDSEVVKGRNIQHIIALPSIGINDAVRHDFALNDGYQCG